MWLRTEEDRLRRKWKRKSRKFKVSMDYKTGFYFFMVDGKRIYIRTPYDAMKESDVKFLNDEIYFKYYRPTGNDIVVDIGAGNGQEAVLLAAEAPDVTYLAVEVQPWMFECLCQNFSELPPSYKPYSLLIGDPGEYFINTGLQSVDANISGVGSIPVNSITWDAFLRKFSVTEIDLLKVNIEGGERGLLLHIGNMDNIKRVVISAHDFRADRGDGEYFRTRAFVEETLKGNGFSVTRYKGDAPWVESWVYAERL